MTELFARGIVRSTQMDAIVIRCGCTDDQKADPDWHGFRQIQCPNPRAEEDLGTIGYWHANPFKRMLWNLRRLLNR